jgi:NAD-dependent SIR2 family protein deacetylase
MKEQFIKYQQKRDVLFVFGAGASIADGGPLQRDLLPEILKEEYADSELANLVKRFIKENFDTESENVPSLESVFGYLDYFISKKESLKGGYTTIQLISIKESLIRLIHHRISVSKSRKGIYKKFLECLDRHNKNVSIITMNYDTLLDESFDFLYPSKALIDYCINFMNYEEYDKIDAFNWWDNPREPVTIWDDKIPTPIKIIKIHGSLNWKYCNCCNQVLLTPWDTNIDIKTQGFKGKIGASCENPEEIIFDLKCPNDETPFDTFIVPPSHIKDLNHPAISKLFDEAAIEIRKTKKIVFVGYSFPEADVHIKALFKKNMLDGTEIEVVDPYLNDTIKSNYKSISHNAVFIKDSFENYIEEHLENKIKTTR